MPSTSGTATSTGVPATDSLANRTLPTARVEASEMSISPCTTIGNRPNAIRPNTTKKAAEFIRLVVSRK